jgi:hypothetical protein
MTDVKVFTKQLEIKTYKNRKLKTIRIIKEIKKTNLEEETKHIVKPIFCKKKCYKGDMLFP